MVCHCHFTLILGLPVHIQRISLIIRFPGSCALPVKHVVRADIHHFQTQLPAYFRNVLCTVSIDFAADLHIILCSIHSRVGSTVDNSFHIRLPDHFSACLGICDIHLLHIHANAYMASLSQLVHYVMSQLSLYTCH